MADYRVISKYTLLDIMADYEANDMTNSETYLKLQKIYNGEEQ